MALLTALEFSELCNVPRTSFASYENRGKIIASGSGKDKKYDTDDEKNKAFIQRMSSKGMQAVEVNNLLNHIAKVPVRKEPPPKRKKGLDFEEDPGDASSYELDSSGVPEYHVSEKILKFRDVQKRESEIELNSLKIMKQRGEVVPAMLIHPIFLQHNQYIINEFKNSIDETLRLFAKMKDLSAEESAQLKGIMIERVNDAMKTAATNTAASVKSIIDDYTSKRAAGERL